MIPVSVINRTEGTNCKDCLSEDLIDVLSIFDVTGHELADYTLYTRCHQIPAMPASFNEDRRFLAIHFEPLVLSSDVLPTES